MEIFDFGFNSFRHPYRSPKPGGPCFPVGGPQPRHPGSRLARGLPCEVPHDKDQTLRESGMYDPLDSASFGEYVLKSEGLVVVNFWTRWSEECRQMSYLMADVQPLLDEKDSIVQVDWDQERQLAQDLDVLGVPTLLLFVGGNEVARYYGTMSEEDLRECLAAVKNTEGKKRDRPDPL